MTSPFRHTLSVLPLALSLAYPFTASAQVQTTTDRAATLPAINVEAQADRETATGPVYGYRAQRSATATKTDTPLSETAQSVTVVTREQIVDQGATSIQEALNYAAGVRSDAYGVDSRSDGVRVRGTEPAMFLDGLRQNYDYYTSTTRPDPYTLERLEVLRGPSSMLYGQGGTAGIVNMVSKRPLAEAQNEVGVQIGNHGRKQAQFDLTGPATQDGQWLYRLVGVVRDADTQVDHVPDDRIVFAPSLTWKPSAATSLTLQALVQNDNSGTTAQFLPWSGVRTDNPNGRLSSKTFIGEPDFDRYDSKRRTIGWQFDHQFNDQWSFSQGFRHAENRVDYFQHYADSFSLPGGYAIDPVGQRLVNRYGYGNVNDVRIDTLDQNVQGRLQTGDVQHTVLFGLDWNSYHRDSRTGYGGSPIDVFNPVYGNYPAISLADDPRFKQRQTGVYAQDQMKFGQNWIVTAGLRHDRAKTSLEGSQSDEASATTKRFALMYAADNGWSPYVSYGESFTPVASTTRGTAIETYKPLRGEQWEIGVKQASVDGKQAFNAAVYDLKEKNRLVGDPTNALNSIQVGKTKTQGLELEYRGAITNTLDVIAHYNYIDLDDQLEGIPRHQASAWGKWRFAVGNVSGFSLGAGVRWMNGFADGAAPRTPSVVLLDSMLAYDAGPWRYALNINNLTDKSYVATCLSRGDCWFGARRSVIASATYKF